MNQYILLLHEQQNADAGLSPDEMQAVVQRYITWSQNLGQRGLLVSGERLDSHGGQIVRTAGGDMIVSDGPYAETKDIVSGFFIVRADTMAGAAELAKECPHAQRGFPVEVRELPNTG